MDLLGKAQKFIPDLAGNLKPKQDGQSPAALTHYWEMTPPKRLMIGESKQGGAGSQLQNAGGYGPAPRISPVGQSGKDNNKVNENSPMPSKHINVRDDHHWTESPISAKREIPVLNLKEMRILMNPMLNQLANNVFAFAGAAGQAVAQVEQIYDRLTGQGFDFDTEAKKLEGGESSANDEQKKAEKKKEDQRKGLAQLGNYVEDQAASLNETTVTDYANPMNPYSLLYTTKPTNFKYSFPYLEDRYIENNGMFGDEPQNAGSLVQGLSDAAAGATKLLQQLTLNKMFAPGRMIEEPKAFTFSGREKSYTVSFPLFNTKSYQDIVRNWQFIYLLAYQNTPNRVNRDLIDPPCIYEAYIPGVWYSKYSALTNMTVDFIGARREMPIPIKFIDKADNATSEQSTWNMLPSEKKIITVIPDAFQVTLTFTELFAETQNMKYQMMMETLGKVQTGVFSEG